MDKFSNNFEKRQIVDAVISSYDHILDYKKYGYYFDENDEPINFGYPIRDSLLFVIHSDEWERSFFACAEFNRDAKRFPDDEIDFCLLDQVSSGDWLNLYRKSDYGIGEPLNYSNYKIGFRPLHENPILYSISIESVNNINKQIQKYIENKIGWSKVKEKTYDYASYYFGCNLN